MKVASCSWVGMRGKRERGIISKPGILGLIANTVEVEGKRVLFIAVAHMVGGLGRRDEVWENT